MATNIKTWSTTPGSNNATPPNGAPEGMAPSTVNDVIRQNMAEIRSWYQDPAWVDLGYTYTYVSTTSFKISGLDKTADFVVGRRVRAVGATTGTIYGQIATSVFSTDTTVTITWDSGTLANETLAVSIGIPSLGKPIPYLALGLTGNIAMADLANLAQGSVIGRASGAGTGVPSAQTFATVWASVLTTVNSWTVAQRGAVTALTDGATITPDFSLANNFSLTIGGNRTLANPTNQVAGQSGCIVITQDGTGSRTLSYGANWKFPNATAPVLTTTAAAVDLLYYYVAANGTILANLNKGFG